MKRKSFNIISSLYKLELNLFLSKKAELYNFVIIYSMSIENLEHRLNKIEARNKKVEANKAWETSLARKTILVIITYLVVGLTLTTIKNPQPWINAIIPSLGFFLSTLTLSFVKDYWLKHIYKS